MLLPITIFIATLVVALAVLAFLRPAHGFTLLTLTYPFEQLLQSQFPFFSENPAFINFFTATVTAASLALAIVRGRKTLLLERTTIFVGLLFATVIASVFWSINPGLSWHTIKYWAPYLGAGLLLFPLTVSTPTDAITAAKSFLTVGVPLAFGLWLAPLLGRSIVIQQSDSFGLGNPLAIGTFGAEITVVAVGFLFSVRNRPLLKLFLLLSATLGVLVILRSGSRGQLIAAMIGIAVVSFGVLSGARRKTFLYSFIPACLLVASFLYVTDTFVSSSNADWIAQRWSLEAIQATIEKSRIQMASNLLNELTKAASANPFVLIGGMGAASSYDLFGGYCHVVPVEALCEYGMAGAALYLAFNITAFLDIRTVFKSTSLSVNEKTAIALMAGIFAMYLTLTFKQGSLFGHTEYLGTAMIIGRLRTASFGSRVSPAAIANEPRVRKVLVPLAPTTPRFTGPPHQSQFG